MTNYFKDKWRCFTAPPHLVSLSSQSSMPPLTLSIMDGDTVGGVAGVLPASCYECVNEHECECATIKNGSKASGKMWSMARQDGVFKVLHFSCS